MQESMPKFSIGRRALSQLRARVVPAQADLLHRFASGALGVLLFHFERRESFVVEKCNWIVERFDEVSGLACCEFCCKRLVDLILESRDIHVGGWHMQFTGDRW